MFESTDEFNNRVKETVLCSTHNSSEFRQWHNMEMQKKEPRRVKLNGLIPQRLHIWNLTTSRHGTEFSGNLTQRGPTLTYSNLEAHWHIFDKPQ